MGKVFPGMVVSAHRYHIEIPLLQCDDVPEQLEEHDTLTSFDLEAVIQASHRIIDDSSTDARALMNNARQRAKAIVAKALEMASELEIKGYEDGLSRAATEQDSAIQTAVREARDAMMAIVDNVRSERRQFFINAESELVNLSIEMAKKILQREIEANPEGVTFVARAALKRLSEREEVTIRVSPEDLDCIRSHRDEFLHETDIGNLRIVSDPRVDRGGVIIETDSGSIDGRIEAQLLVAKEALLEHHD